MLARSILARFLFAVGVGVVAGALPVTQSTPVTRQEVWEALAVELRHRGVTERRLPQFEDLDLPVAIPAHAERKLRVVSRCWDEGLQRTQFRLQCGSPGQCLPFLAYLRDSVNADAAPQAASCRLTSGVRPTPQTAPKFAVRAGDRATATFLGDRLRMTASVTCLERGREGEVVRVRSHDGQVFRARISGPGQLEALPQELVSKSTSATQAGEPK
jgi:Chaperone for flagella basal body P-ring formation